MSTDIDPDRTRLVNRIHEAGEAYRASSRANAQLFVEHDEAVYAAYSAPHAPMTVRELAALLGESTELVKARIDRVRRLWSDPEKRQRFFQPSGGGFTGLGAAERDQERASG